MTPDEMTWEEMIAEHEEAAEAAELHEAMLERALDNIEAEMRTRVGSAR